MVRDNTTNWEKKKKKAAFIFVVYWVRIFMEEKRRHASYTIILLKIFYLLFSSTHLSTLYASFYTFISSWFRFCFWLFNVIYMVLYVLRYFFFLSSSTYSQYDSSSTFFFCFLFIFCFFESFSIPTTKKIEKICVCFFSIENFWQNG